MLKTISDWTASILNLGVTTSTTNIDVNCIQIANSFFLSVSILVGINVVANVIEQDIIGL